MPKTTPSIIEVPEMVFIMVDGSGNPNTSPDYKNCRFVKHVGQYRREGKH